MKARLKRDLMELMLVPGLSGHEDRVRRSIRNRLDGIGVDSTTDRLGNLVAHFPGQGPSVMLFAHMDQLGFIVRRIEASGLLRLERLGGVPERALAAQDVLICVGEGRDVPGVIANKSHHATSPEEKYRVLPYAEVFVDAGFASAADVEAAGIRIGAPVIYRPHVAELANDRIMGTSVDDRAGCAVLLELARRLKDRKSGPPVHLAFTVLEEFNLRGAQPLAQSLRPDIAIQLDLMLASDTPDMATRGDMALGGGPGMSLYSFHGRGTLNGVIPHPALVALFDRTAAAEGIPLQRSAQVGVLTDLSYVQLVGDGVAAIDLGFPMRYSHSARELCDLGDLVALTRLLEAALAGIGADFSLGPGRVYLMTYTLGIDIGTYETKGVLVDPSGKVHAQASRGHKMQVPNPGWAEHDAESDWWGDFVFVCRSLLSTSGIDAREIKAVACSAIGPCMLPVDAQGAPLMNGVLYGVDGRAEAEVLELSERIGEATIIARCGNALTSQSVGPKILWLKRRRPEIYAETAHVLTSTSFLVQRLTGEVVIDHYTAANFSPLYDVTTRTWLDDLADDILPLEKLPRLLWSNEIAGHITQKAAAQTGLAEGTPVTAGTIDAAAEALSVGVDRPGDMMMMYGSTIFIILRTLGRVSDPRIWYAPWLFAGEHASMAGLATSGTLTHWFRDQMARDLDPDTAFPALAAEAETSPPCANGLLMLPYFSGERTPIHDIHAKGALFGLNLTHTRGDMYRALIEGIAHGTRHVTDTFAELGQAPDRLLAVGGGTKNALWLQATSDITGIDQIVCEKTIGASYGDAFLAALAVGLAERADIAAWNPVAQIITARPDPRYEKAHALFRSLYEQTKDIARKIG